jgi:hypothetical protein
MKDINNKPNTFKILIIILLLLTLGYFLYLIQYSENINNYSDNSLYELKPRIFINDNNPQLIISDSKTEYISNDSCYIKIKGIIENTGKKTASKVRVKCYPKIHPMNNNINTFSIEFSVNNLEPKESLMFEEINKIDCSKTNKLQCFAECPDCK